MWGQASREGRRAIRWLINSEKEWRKVLLFLVQLYMKSPLTTLPLGISPFRVDWEQAVRITLLFAAEDPSGPWAGFPRPLLVLRHEPPAPWRTTNFCIPQLPSQKLAETLFLPWQSRTCRTASSANIENKNCKGLSYLCYTRSRDCTHVVRWWQRVPLHSPGSYGQGDGKGRVGYHFPVEQCLISGYWEETCSHPAAMWQSQNEGPDAPRSGWMASPMEAATLQFLCRQVQGFAKSVKLNSHSSLSFATPSKVFLLKN